MIGKVAFTMYPAADMARARSFYEDILGLQRGFSRDTHPWTEYDLPGGGCLAISSAIINKPSTSAGGTIAFEVDDLDATIADLESKQVKFLSDLIAGPACRMRFIEDSEGNAIILHEVRNKRE